MAKLSKDELMQAIEEMSVLELSELVKALEEKFGVSAAAMAVAAPAAGAPTAGGEEAAPAEEQTVFNVVIANSGAQKIAVIKALRELVPTLGLKEQKTWLTQHQKR
jgi:ribosomal protein L7/L12